MEIEQQDIEHEISCRIAEGLIRKLPPEWIKELVERLGICTNCFKLDSPGCHCWDDY